MVEDDDDHAEFLIRTLRSRSESDRIERVSDGADAIAYLEGAAPYGGRILPDLVILDLKMPKLDGHEVLERIKSQPTIRSIPIVVLTTSDTESDRRKAYERGANGYLVKPTDFDDFRRMVRDLGAYWGDWNRTIRPSAS